MRKHLFVITCLQLSILTVVFGQSPAEALKKKNVSDTILQNRSLLLQGTFDAQRALLQLFPGKHYRLTDGKNVNEMIKWDCKRCAAKN